MRIATYNIWDSQAGMPERFEQLAEEIRAVRADVLCLQEVADSEICDRLARKTGYENVLCRKAAGTAILSRYPMEEAEPLDYGVAVRLTAEGVRLLIANVHLPWRSALEKERAAAEIVRRMKGMERDYALLAGDFNGSDQSAVHHFFRGDQSLNGEEAYFFDLAEAWAEQTGEAAGVTLNFRENPRWGVVNPVNTVEVSQRFDRIYLENPYPKEYPVLRACGLFGTEVSQKTGLAASDHYGVYAELGF